SVLIEKGDCRHDEQIGGFCEHLLHARLHVRDCNAGRRQHAFPVFSYPRRMLKNKEFIKNSAISRQTELFQMTMAACRGVLNNGSGKLRLKRGRAFSSCFSGTPRESAKPTAC